MSLRQNKPSRTVPIVEGAIVGELQQTRFKPMPSEHLSRETVAGIRDMSLGRVKNGKPTGAPIIRFDNGQNTGTHPHININPRGRPNPSDPHIKVPAEVIKSAKVISKMVKYIGIPVRVATVVIIDTLRMVTAIKEDIYTSENVDEIIAELQDTIQKLNESLHNESDSTKRDEISDTLHHFENVLREVKRSRKVPCLKSIETGSSIIGGVGGGIAGGYAGGIAGAAGGGALGMCACGPVCAVVGTVAGGILGSIGGGVVGDIAGSAFAEAIAELALKLADD